MTGWGQEGPLAQAAGHDINYIALAGNLHGYGRAGGTPTPPVNAVGDFGGGGMLLAFAHARRHPLGPRDRQGQVIDCAMVDGAALLAAQTWSLLAAGMWKDERGANLLDTGAAFYDSYECADGKWVAVGALEPQFFAVLKEKLGLASSQLDPGLRDELTPPVPRAAARPLVRPARRQRRLLRAGAVAGRGARPSAQCRARHLHRRSNGYTRAQPRAPLQGNLMLDLSRRTAFNEEHDLFRDQVRHFFERELIPHLDRWEEQGDRSTATSGRKAARRACSARPCRRTMAGSASISATMR